MPTICSMDEARLRRALLERACFGSSPGNRAQLDQLGYDVWLARQLEPDQISDSGLEAKLLGYPWLQMDAAAMRQSFGGGGWRLSEESKAVRLLRAKESERQLFERVVDFWNDHFNIPFTAQDANYLRPVHEETVIRRHALGTFPRLLGAVAQSPAMAAFLDQDSNQAGAPNENYARELLELHTLGEGSGYTEEDVREVSRCFTGWSYVRHWEPGPFGTSVFRGALHDDGPKTVLGHAFTGGGGQLDGLRVLRILGTHPRTARFISEKLVSWFLGEAAALGAGEVAGQPIVDRVTATYLSTGGDIKAMVLEILSARALEAVQPWRRTKLKQPFHFAVSFLRALDVEVTDPTTAIYGIAGMGQVPFEWPDPDGFPDGADAWVANLAPRWRFVSAVLNDWTSWSRLDVQRLSSLCAGAGPDQWGRAVAAALCSGTMDVTDAREIQAFVDGAPGAPGDADLVGAFELGASSPSFQIY